MIQLIFTCLQLNLIQFSPWPPARAWLDCISFSGRCLLRERAAGSSSRFSWRMNHWYRGICSQFAGDSSQSVEQNRIYKNVRSVLYEELLTFLPTRLLCKFIKLRASPSISRASRNLRAKLIPNFMSAEQPPHFHGRLLPPFVTGHIWRTWWFRVECELRWALSHPQSDILPRAQAEVIAWTAPALATAYVKAASRDPVS